MQLSTDYEIKSNGLDEILLTLKKMKHSWLRFQTHRNDYFLASLR
jgi:hypothetical protein